MEERRWKTKKELKQGKARKEEIEESKKHTDLRLFRALLVYFVALIGKALCQLILDAQPMQTEIYSV